MLSDASHVGPPQLLKAAAAKELQDRGNLLLNLQTAPLSRAFSDILWFYLVLGKTKKGVHMGFT